MVGYGRLCVVLHNKFAAEVADLARLIKGYGSTHRRGMRNFLYIIDKYVRPILKAGSIPNDAADKLRLARNAANKDPDGSDLDKIFVSNYPEEIIVE